MEVPRKQEEEEKMGDDAAHVSVAPPRLPPITTMTRIAARHAFLFFVKLQTRDYKTATRQRRLQMATSGRQDMDENAWIQLSNGTASCEASYPGSV